MQPAPERRTAGVRTQALVGELNGDCFAATFKVKSPQPPFGEPGVCPPIVLFSSTTNQFLIGGAFPTELFRLKLQEHLHFVHEAVGINDLGGGGFLGGVGGDDAFGFHLARGEQVTQLVQ